MQKMKSLTLKFPDGGHSDPLINIIINYYNVAMSSNISYLKQGWVGAGGLS